MSINEIKNGRVCSRRAIVRALYATGVLVGVIGLSLLVLWIDDSIRGRGPWTKTSHPVVLTVHVSGVQSDTPLQVVWKYFEVEVIPEQPKSVELLGEVGPNHSVTRRINIDCVENQWKRRILSYGGYHIDIYDSISGERRARLSLSDALGVLSEEEEVGNEVRHLSVTIELPPGD